jgi:uncharacterized protein (DUF697 family)
MEQEATGHEAPDKKDSPVVAVPAASETAEMTDARRDELASKLVDRFSLYSGGAGLIPIPLVDIAAVAGVQIQMLRRLSEIYGVAFSENLGKSAITGIVGTAVPAATAAGVGSALKSVPVIGTAIGTLTMSVGAAGATYLVGKVFIQHFASGGTLLDFNAPDYAAFLKTHSDKLKGHTDKLKGHADTVRGHAETGAEKLKASAEKLKSRFWSSKAAESEPAAAAPTTSTKEPAATSS